VTAQTGKLSSSTVAPHSDPAFPRLHGRPARGWVNDPNGCSYVDGRFHVFFQHNAKAPEHDAITWGHVSSSDLVEWRHEPVALVNRPGELDQFGCWSGCVVDDDGTPTAVYSAVADGSGRSAVVLARGDRQMRTWKQGTTAVTGMPDDPEITDVRDPFVFRFEGRRYAVQGAGHKDGRPQVLVYECDDLERWTLLGPLLSGDDPVAGQVAAANIWECPNLIQLDGRWVLIVSQWRQFDGAGTLSGVRYLLGALEATEEGPRFRPTSGGVLDEGPCFYAPQVLVQDDRVLLWAWSWERGRSVEQIADAGWAGVLTFCRQLSLVGDVLVSTPVPELEALRREPLPIEPGQPFTAGAFDVEVGADAGTVSLWIVQGDDEQLAAEWVVPGDPLTRPRLLVDGSMIEIFPGTGETFTTRAYPTAASRWRLDVSRGTDLRAWRLGLATPLC
jgi:beta-fructofuranosidase